MKMEASSESTKKDKGLWDKIGDKIASMWSKERKEGEPRIKLKIFFSEHSDSAHVKAFAEEFRKCDIYIPELNGWRIPTLKAYNDLSQGTLERRDFGDIVRSNFPNFFFAERDLIYGSKKPILFVDVPAGHPLVKEYDEIEQRYENRLRIAKGFEEMLNAEKDHIQQEGENEKKREEYMVASFIPTVRKFLKEHPYYKTGEELNILMFLGAMHTSLYSTLKEKNNGTSRDFENSPIVFSCSEEVLRAVVLGRAPSDDMFAKALLEVMAYSELFAGKMDKAIKEKRTNQVMQRLSKFIRLLNLKEIREIIDGARNKQEMRHRLISLATEKNVDFKALF